MHFNRLWDQMRIVRVGLGGCPPPFRRSLRHMFNPLPLALKPHPAHPITVKCSPYILAVHQNVSSFNAGGAGVLISGQGNYFMIYASRETTSQILESRRQPQTVDNYRYFYLYYYYQYYYDYSDYYDDDYYYHHHDY